MTINEPRNNYKIPLDFSSFFDERKGGLGKCTEVESIDAHIELLITTYQGECSFDKQYGSTIGELDFEQEEGLCDYKLYAMVPKQDLFFLESSHVYCAHFL